MLRICYINRVFPFEYKLGQENISKLGNNLLISNMAYTKEEEMIMDEVASHMEDNSSNSNE